MNNNMNNNRMNMNTNDDNENDRGRRRRRSSRSRSPPAHRTTTTTTNNNNNNNNNTNNTNDIYTTNTTKNTTNTTTNNNLFEKENQRKQRRPFKNPERADGSYSDQEIYKEAMDHLDYRRLKRYKLWAVEDPKYHEELWQKTCGEPPSDWSETDESERFERILKGDDERKEGKEKKKNEVVKPMAGPTMLRAAEPDGSYYSSSSYSSGYSSSESGERKRKRKKRKSSKDDGKKTKRSKRDDKKRHRNRRERKSKKKSSTKKNKKKRSRKSSSSSSSDSESSESDEGEIKAGGMNDGFVDNDQPERFLRFLQWEEKEKKDDLARTIELERKKKLEQQANNNTNNSGAVLVAADFGPAPPSAENTNVDGKVKPAPGGYGGQLLQGEGTAMAQFVQSGQRIPRRGEVGYSSEQIENFEKMGYVMSGSRHAKMNAVRLRKENQVYSAEEQAALAMINYEEKAEKEKQVMEELKKLVERAKQK